MGWRQLTRASITRLLGGVPGTALRDLPTERMAD